MSSSVIHVVTDGGTLIFNGGIVFHYMYIPHFLYWLICGHWLNSLRCLPISFGYTTRSGITALHGHSLSNFLRSIKHLLLCLFDNGHSNRCEVGFAFLWQLVLLSTFSYILLCLFWKNVCSDPLTIFNWVVFCYWVVWAPSMFWILTPHHIRFADIFPILWLTFQVDGWLCGSFHLTWPRLCISALGVIGKKHFAKTKIKALFPYFFLVVLWFQALYLSF